MVASPHHMTSMATNLTGNKEVNDAKVESEVEEEEEQEWGDWNANDEKEADDLYSDLLYLFCDSKYSSIDALFQHCTCTHHFDFHAIRKTCAWISMVPSSSSITSGLR